MTLVLYTGQIPGGQPQRRFPRAIIPPGCHWVQLGAAHSNARPV